MIGIINQINTYIISSIWKPFEPLNVCYIKKHGYIKPKIESQIYLDIVVTIYYTTWKCG